MWQDPFTLIIAVGKDGKAKGQVYLDDGVGYAYESGEFVWRVFELDGKMLRSKSHPEVIKSKETGVAVFEQGNAFAEAISHVKINSIVFLGLSSKPASIKSNGVELEFEWEEGKDAKGKKEGKASELKVKNPGVGVVEDWEIVLA